MIRRPPRSTLSSSSAASDVYKRQPLLRGPAQDAEVPARLPHPLRLDRSSSPALSMSNLLRLVQRRAPAHRTGVARPRRRALRARAQAVHAERASVLGAAYAAHPERFVHKPPAPPSPVSYTH